MLLCLFSPWCMCTEAVFSSNSGGGWRESPGAKYRISGSAVQDSNPPPLSSRIFSFLDVVTLCRCAQVSRVSLCSWDLYENYDKLLTPDTLPSLPQFVPSLSPGTFLPWMAAIGKGLTSLTSRGTLRWVSPPRSHFNLNLVAFFWLVYHSCQHILHSITRYCSLGDLSRITALELQSVVFFLTQGRVVENISKRCGGFLRKLSLRGCLGVGDSALRWAVEGPGKKSLSQAPSPGPVKINDA